MSTNIQLGIGAVQPRNAPVGSAAGVAAMRDTVSSYMVRAAAGRRDGSKRWSSGSSGLKMFRMPTARSIASRATAKISGRRSNGFSPLAMRARNSSVFAMSCASVRPRTEVSWRFTRSTCFR